VDVKDINVVKDVDVRCPPALDTVHAIPLVSLSAVF
jgi:hypothetical protein